MGGYSVVTKCVFPDLSQCCICSSFDDFYRVFVTDDVLNVRSWNKWCARVASRRSFRVTTGSATGLDLHSIVSATSPGQMVTPGVSGPLFPSLMLSSTQPWGVEGEGVMRWNDLLVTPVFRELQTHLHREGSRPTHMVPLTRVHERLFNARQIHQKQLVQQIQEEIWNTGNITSAFQLIMVLFFQIWTIVSSLSLQRKLDWSKRWMTEEIGRYQMCLSFIFKKIEGNDAVTLWEMSPPCLESHTKNLNEKLHFSVPASVFSQRSSFPVDLAERCKQHCQSQAANMV